MGYVLGAFAVYLTLVGVLIASAPWWGAAVCVGCLLGVALFAAPEAGRMLANASCGLGHAEGDA